MFKIEDQKGFNRSLKKYINHNRRRDNGVFYNISQKFSKLHKKFKKNDSSISENLSEHEIKVEEENEGFFKRLLKGKTKKEQEHIEEEINHKPEKDLEEMKEITKDYEVLEEVEEEIEHKKDGLFTKFKKMLKSKPKAHDEETVPIEQVERVIEGKPAKHSDDPVELREDLKKVSKIILSLVHELDQEKQDAFKRSVEFASYKEILEKHNLVK